MNKMNILNKKWALYFFVFSLLLLVTISYSLVYFKNELNQSRTADLVNNELISKTNSSSKSDEKETLNIVDENEMKKSIQFIAEEEKLAGDVYSFLYDKWGSKIFKNISNSETNHQKLVNNYMTTNNIESLSKQEFGQFTNQDIQALYNELTAKGSISLEEALNVGIYIEKKDIADLSEIINENANNPELIDVLNKLLSGSESHLKAFSRQAS